MESELALTTDMILVLGVLGLTMILFIFEVFRVDVTAIAVMVLLGLTGLVPGEHLFDGFASNAVIAIIAVMMLGAGLDRTGAMIGVTSWLLRMGRNMEPRLTALICGSVGLLSAAMQNVGAAALFLPVVSRIAARTGIAPSRLMMPMGFCAIVGGTITMIGSSPMILLNELIQNANRTLPQGAGTLHTFPMFSVAPIGLVLLAMAVIYMSWLGRRMLPAARDASSGQTRSTEDYFSEVYGIHGEIIELLVTADSPLVGQRIGEAEAGTGAPVLLALKNSDDPRLAPPGDEMIWVGSVLGVMGPRDLVQLYADSQQLRVLKGLRNFGDLFNASRAGISELVVGPASRFVGRSAAQLRLRKSYGLSVLALNRAGEIHRDQARQMPLRVGDCLVVHSFWRDIAPLARERDVMVASDIPHEEGGSQRVALAVALCAGAFILVSVTDLKLAVCLMAAALGMVLGGILSMDDAYKAVSWKSVFLVGSLISLGYAMETTGTAAWIAQEMVSLVGEVHPVWMQLIISVLGGFFAIVMSSVGATIMLVPLAINVALAIGADPQQFALIAALATCNAFVLPTDQVNSLVNGPGGYRVVDYVKVGSIMSVLYVITMVGMVNLMWWLTSGL